MSRIDFSAALPKIFFNIDILKEILDEGCDQVRELFATTETTETLVGLDGAFDQVETAVLTYLAMRSLDNASPVASGRDIILDTADKLVREVFSKESLYHLAKTYAGSCQGEERALYE